MARPRLRRWHLDVAVFLGLTLFVCCYWYHTPAPLWIARLTTDPKVYMSASALGFSTDGQSYFTIKDLSVFINHQPRPMIQRWNAMTGELLAEYPLQMNAEDRARFTPDSIMNGFHQPLRPAKVLDADVMYTVHEMDGAADSLRYYNLMTGECLNHNKPLLAATDFWYLRQNPVDGHHLGCFRQSREPNEPLHIYDLTIGITIHSIPGELKHSAHSTLLSPDGQYFFVVWIPSVSHRLTEPAVLSVHRPGTWEVLQRLTMPLKPFDIIHMAVTPGNHLEFKCMQRPMADWQIATLRYRIHRQTHTLEQDGEITVHAHTSHPDYATATVFIHQLMYQNTRPLTEPLLTIHNYLLRYGLSLVRTRPILECRVSDLTDGQLLRHLRVSGFTYSPLSVSPTGHYLAGLQSTDSPNGATQHSLWMYEIPHHLREPTLRWLMYLSWLLILPWPLRYLLRPTRTAINNANLT